MRGRCVERCHGGREVGAVVHLTGGATVERHRADLFEMEHVRSEHDRDFHGAGLEEVLPAVRHQAAADERYVGGRVEPLQFAHRIADEHLGADGQGGRRSAAQRDCEPTPAAQCRDGVEPLGVPRHEHEQQRGKAPLEQRVRLENSAFLARVRARGDQDGPLTAPVSA